MFKYSIFVKFFSADATELEEDEIIWFDILIMVAFFVLEVSSNFLLNYYDLSEEVTVDKT